MKYSKVILILFFISLTCCNTYNNYSEHKIIQKQRDNIDKISDDIIDIKPEIFFGNSYLTILDNVLIVSEISPKGEFGIHLFNKNTFKYLLSVGKIGKGPGEIIAPGPIGLDKKNKIFWIPDAGKRVMYKFPLDSVLNNSRFNPSIEVKLDDNLFLFSFSFLNDSTIFGKSVNLSGQTNFEMVMSKMNLKTKKIHQFGYENPKAIGKNSNSLFALSNDYNYYVNCYYLCDLVTICDLEGNLKYNIYGPGWFDSERNKNSYFYDVNLYGKYIIGSYIGKRTIFVKGNISKGNLPSKLIVFDMNGNYIKTIETGFEFRHFCIDEENKRIIAYFTNRDEPLGYFNFSL